MDIDFHYYATYAAALVAGYTDVEAYTIAHAAQYVDVSDYSDMIKEALLPGLSNPTATIEGSTKMVAKNLVSTKAMEDESEAIWCSFHFLPGNLNGEKNYTGNENYEEDHLRKFRLLCLANSELSAAMINDVIRNHTNNAYYLHLVGIRMHVLADTWAHAYYAGTMSYWVNEVADGTVRDLGGNSITQLYFRDMTSPALSSNSYSYLGHGRMGHLPDIPYRVYKYTPHWSNQEITKNNPVDYLCAFSQMVKTMECIRYKELTQRLEGKAPATLALEFVRASLKNLDLQNELKLAEGEIPGSSMGERAGLQLKKQNLKKQIKEQGAKVLKLEQLVVEMAFQQLEVQKESAKQKALACSTEKLDGSMQLPEDSSVTQVNPAVIPPELSYVANSYTKILPALQGAIKAAFSKTGYSPEKAAEIWNPIIKTYFPDATQLPKYNNNLWLNDAKGRETAKHKQFTDYYLFNEAAKIHRAFVLTYLDEKRALPPQQGQ